jgi:DDE superfamily endonuclease
VQLKTFLQDEARFGRITDPRNCWAPPGCRPVVKKQIVREYIYAYGAVCPFDGDSCYLILPRMDAACMNVFLAELSGRYPNNLLLVVYDGAPCHSKGALKIPANIRVVTLPPHSPELNPAENKWDDMREKFFGNMVFDSIKAVEDRLITACKFYEQNPKIVQSFSAWNWIIDVY